MVEWRIGPASAAHITALAACHIASWREAYDSLVPAHLLAAFDLDSSAITWERRRTDGRYRLLVACHGDDLIGFAAASRQPTGSELEALYVRAAWHGTGVADDLLAAAVPPRALQSVGARQLSARARLLPQARFCRYGSAPHRPVHAAARTTLAARP
ncbi:GNAT family N-acetyltransferase [Nocardia rosealba]|uniref:GNAT family N-acetyltransferase n=1 Tax=Nocardia rosealba TaxID=2878563 RepID=UPI001CD98565|nr:GNAT family N-acetyltransferase [Nocardia rosealba]MCA2206710.1 GNAT family N-acetyltransferase [Nocardia rosealba]